MHKVLRIIKYHTKYHPHEMIRQKPYRKVVTKRERMEFGPLYYNGFLHLYTFLIEGG